MKRTVTRNSKGYSEKSKVQVEVLRQVQVERRGSVYILGHDVQVGQHDVWFLIDSVIGVHMVSVFCTVLREMVLAHSESLSK